jgi:prolipoprotein diacylglyceryltransferase
VLVSSGYQPGTALSWYVIAYGVGRFGFEFMRGTQTAIITGTSPSPVDFPNPYRLVASAELSGLLPFHPWHIGAIVCLLLAVIGVTLKRRLQKTAKHRLLHPYT